MNRELWDAGGFYWNWILWETVVGRAGVREEWFVAVLRVIDGKGLGWHVFAKEGL